MTDTVQPSKLQLLVQSATANPAELTFPTDQWGFTSQIKKEVLRAAASVRGQDDKHELLVGTIAVLLQHIKLRKESDKALEVARMTRWAAAQQERQPREQVYTEKETVNG